MHDNSIVLRGAGSRTPEGNLQAVTAGFRHGIGAHTASPHAVAKPVARKESFQIIKKGRIFRGKLRLEVAVDGIFDGQRPGYGHAAAGQQFDHIRARPCKALQAVKHSQQGKTQQQGAQGAPVTLPGTGLEAVLPTLTLDEFPHRFLPARLWYGHDTRHAAAPVYRRSITGHMDVSATCQLTSRCPRRGSSTRL